MISRWELLRFLFYAFFLMLNSVCILAETAVVQTRTENSAKSAGPTSPEKIAALNQLVTQQNKEIAATRGRIKILMEKIGQLEQQLKRQDSNLNSHQGSQSNSQPNAQNKVQPKQYTQKEKVARQE